MRLSVKTCFKAQIPKRGGNRTVVIELGEEKRLKTLSVEKRLDTSRMNQTFNSSVEKENLKSSRSIHRIKSKQKPLSLSKASINSISKPKQELSSPPRETQTIRTLHSMIEQLLQSKKGTEQKTQKNISYPSTHQKEHENSRESIQSLIISKVINQNSRKIQIPLPFANLDLIQPQFWNSYEGELKNSSRHGHGTLYLTNGEKFTGKFQDNRATGNGTFYKKNGEVIIGVWKSNKLVKRLY